MKKLHDKIKDDKETWSYKNTKGRMPPEGWSFIDWEDNSGHIWSDTIPTSDVKRFASQRNMHLIKIRRG